MLEENLSPVETLKWYLDAGVDETIADAPVDRYAASAEALARQQAARAQPVSPPSTSPSVPSPVARPGRDTPPPTPDAVRAAYALAGQAESMEALRAALTDFEGCPLKGTATNLVFGDGSTTARVMLIGDAPGADEDRLGLPFAGASGTLLDKMLASIGLTREDVFLSNTVFWRPPGNRTLQASEVAVCAPFVERMLELIDPDLLVVLGGAAAASLLGKTESVGRLRGKWYEYATPRLSRPLPAAVLYGPTYLLGSPGQKRNAWRDLLAIKHKLDTIGSRQKE